MKKMTEAELGKRMKQMAQREGHVPKHKRERKDPNYRSSVHRTKLRNHFKKHPERATVRDLATIIDASPDTIRRCCLDLAREGLIEAIRHGHQYCFQVQNNRLPGPAPA